MNLLCRCVVTLVLLIIALESPVLSAPYLSALRSNTPCKLFYSESKSDKQISWIKIRRLIFETLWTDKCSLTVAAIISHHSAHPPRVRCSAHFEEWFYSSGTCTKRAYSACQSSGFATEKECQDTCREELL